MEFVIVTYPTTRSVNIDGVLTGDTNEVLRLDAGTYRFDLGTPPNYQPASLEAVVTGTTVLVPMKVVFTQKKGG